MTERTAWVQRLPFIIAEVTARWSLTGVGPPLRDATDDGCAWVSFVGRRDIPGDLAVLKIGFPHFEEEDEIQGLRFWDGDPAVRLLEADEGLHAMLLERCDPGTSLRELPEDEQDAVVAGLLRRMWRRPSAALWRFRRLEVMLASWIEEAEAGIARSEDPGLVREGISLFRSLPESAPGPRVLLATDLHAGNVLCSQREPWLAIDPKPFLGDPAYDATQHLFNCRDRLLTQPDRTIKRFADLLEVSAERVALWTFARAAAAASSEADRQSARALQVK